MDTDVMYAPAVPETDIARPEDDPTMGDDLTTEDLTAEDLIEEVSIDGMCGVY
ncbi:MAG TPA: mycofactocin precursor MftA [Streptosporangiaceae bacterium]|jgi:mycofactocin precursor|nr:mycofactocin precursor MftA [Streptosporangiaceae bacterium]